jgi:hypothetical protein
VGVMAGPWASVVSLTDRSSTAMTAPGRWTGEPDDVGVQVLPDALDAVGVGAVGRQEVQDDAAAEGGECLAHEPFFVVP